MRLAAMCCGLGVSAADAPAGEVIGGEAPIIYRWVDEDGIAHYTTERERVPANVRSLAVPAPAPEQPQSTPHPWASENAAPIPDAPAAGGAPTRVAPAARAAVTPGPAPRALETQRDALDTKIAELEHKIAQDETALVDMIEAPDADAAAALPDRPEFREIAGRLPRLQAALRSLREQRAELER